MSWMSALGQKRTFCDAGAMSALPPKADIRSGARYVRFVPIAVGDLRRWHLAFICRLTLYSAATNARLAEPASR